MIFEMKNRLVDRVVRELRELLPIPAADPHLFLTLGKLYNPSFSPYACYASVLWVSNEHLYSEKTQQLVLIILKVSSFKVTAGPYLNKILKLFFSYSTVISKP